MLHPYELMYHARERETELRHQAALAAKLKELKKREERPATWPRQAAAQLGQIMISLGLWLQRYGGSQVRAAQ